MLKHNENNADTTILVVGAGYVGLVTAVGWACLGHRVVVVEVNAIKCEMIASGKAPFFEPRLESLLQQHLNKNLWVFNDLKSALSFAQPQFIFLCVGTPSARNGNADLRFVHAAIQDLCAQELAQDVVLICKSTVPVSTTQALQQQVNASGNSRKLDLAFSPEFFSQGQAVDNFLHPDRLVFGIENSDVRRRLEMLHAKFIERGVPIFWMNFASAEMTKYAANAMLATRISFINHIAELTASTGGDIDNVAQALGTDPRIGTHFLQAGIGFGGSCLPKDLRALNFLATKTCGKSAFFSAIDKINLRQRQRFFDLILAHLPAANKLTLGVYGIAFKSGTDDLRESPGLWLVEKLLEQGAKVRVFDPLFTGEAQKKYAWTWANDVEQLLNSDALIITHRDEVIQSLPVTMFKKLSTKTIFDARNNFSPVKFAGTDIKYFSFGRVNPF